ncbi:proton myo-inositol cotransporter-like [Crassostrea virginica]
MSTDTDSDDIEFEAFSMTEKRPLVPESRMEYQTVKATPSHANVQDDPPKQTVPQSTPTFVYTLSFFAAIGGFLFGYDTGVVSGAMLLLQPEFDLDSVWEEMVVSATILFASIFALIGGPLNDVIGRKGVTVTASLVFTGGAVLLGVAQNKIMLLIGRSILGVGIGLASMTVPVYIAECAPAHLRGRLVTVNNLFITGGQFVASVLDGGFSYDKKNGWRWMLGLAAVPSAVQFFGFLFLPESPRWLIKRGRVNEARQVLQKCRGTTDVEEELNKVRELCDEDQRIMEETGKENVLLKIFRTPSVRRAVLVGSGLQLIQQVSGINTVMYYSATIIQMTGIRDTSMAIWLAAMTAGVNFVFTILGVWLVERIGRRPLILGSLTGVLLSLVVLAVGFQLAAFHSPPVTLTESKDTCSTYSFCQHCIEDSHCGFCYTEVGKSTVNGSCVAVSSNLTSGAVQGRCNADPLPRGQVWAKGFCPTDYSWMGLLGLVMYLMFFAPGMGPMPWTINSEIYPLWARSTGNAISTATNWIFNLCVAMSFLTLTKSITTYGTYWLFVGIVFCGLVFIMAALPETKGRSLEEVETLFQGSLCPGFSRKSQYSHNSLQSDGH